MSTRSEERNLAERVFYAEAQYGDEEIEAVIDVLRESRHTLMAGHRVSTFEGAVAKVFGKTHGLMVNSGSSANTLAIASLDMPAGSEVITPALTFSTTVAPLLQHRLVPAFVDVERDTFNVEVGAIPRMISPKTRAMMIPNLLGNLPDWDALKSIADEHDLALIEDSCDTIGSEYRGGTTTNLSDIVTTSFYASHIITAAGFGGMVMTNDDGAHDRMRLLRGWGRSSSLVGESEAVVDRFSVSLDGIPYDAKFVFSAVGYNFLPSEIAAAFGLIQLGRLEQFKIRRETNFETLIRFFERYEQWFSLPRQNRDARTPWLAFPLVVSESAPFSRRELQIWFEERGVQTRVIFTGNVLRQPAFEHVEHRADRGGYPNADAVMRGGILLGCHQSMSEEGLDHIMATFEEFASTQ